jgi:SAM-dependent methyltransferase
MSDTAPPDPRQREEIRDLYGSSYASGYEESWTESDLWLPEAGHNLKTIGDLLDRLGDDARWLDAGCGTGYFMSKFPQVTRAGFDLSPAMLEKAREANPEALFLREHDLCTDVPEWHDAWDLVTCTGQPWSYLATMAEIESCVDNLAAYTATDGICMLVAGDLADLNGCRIDYDFSFDHPAPGTTAITGAIWSHFEAHATHRDMIWPSLDVWVRWFAKHFGHIEIVHWPHDPPLPIMHVPRRVIVATQKRTVDDTDKATVVYDPPPVMAIPHAVSPPEEESTETLAEPAVEPAVEPSADVPDAEPGAAPARLYDLPLSQLVPRLNPLEPRFWRAIGRRGRALRDRFAAPRRAG